MDVNMVIPGKVTHGSFFPDSPLPDVEGRAELFVYAEPKRRQGGGQPANESRVSVFDLLGKAPVLRSGQDIDAQIEEEQNAWDDESTMIYLDSGIIIRMLENAVERFWSTDTRFSRCPGLPVELFPAV